MNDARRHHLARSWIQVSLLVLTTGLLHCAMSVEGMSDGGDGGIRRSDGGGGSDARRDGPADSDTDSGSAPADAAGCDLPTIRCGAACVDTSADLANCGACGHACSASQVCIAGSCQDACPTGFTYCMGTCVDTATSSASCGSCGTRCSATQTCRAGACVSDPPPPTVTPAYLPNRRTYDNERGFVDWSGSVAFETITHRDNTTTPAGVFCGSGCSEQVTRINAGGCVFGNFADVCSFRVQLASEPGAGTAVVTACGQTIGTFNMAGSGTPGFNNFPAAGWVPPTRGACEWRVCVTSAFVHFRATDATYCTAPAAPTVDLRVNGSDGPVTLRAPASFTLSWTSTNAATCVASDAWTGGVLSAGSSAIHDQPAGTYDYRIDCTNSVGTASDTVHVVVEAPFVPAVAADLKVNGNDGTLLMGAPATYELTWTSRNATSCTAERVPAATADPDWTGTVAFAGRRTMTDRPTGTFAYRLTCINSGGSATDVVTVIVDRPPG